MLRIKLLVKGAATALLLLPAFASAQTISIVSGNGQLICRPLCPGPQVFAPLVVQVNDADGNPVANTTVTWTAAAHGVPPITALTATNASGQASYTLSPFLPPIGISYLPATVSAEALNATTNFNETVSSGLSPLEIALVPQGAPPTLTGLAGQTGSVPIKAAVQGTMGGLQGVQVRLVSGTSPGEPIVSCLSVEGQQPGTVLTDSTGIATCTPVFGGQVGSGTYTVVVGGNYATLLPAPLTVNVPPSVIKIISGDSQSVDPGRVAPLPLVAKATDLGGNPVVGATVIWSVSQGSATLTNAGITTLSNGEVSAFVTPTGGPVQVTVALAGDNTVQAVFTISVNGVFTGLELISGNNQIVSLGQTSNPLIVRFIDRNMPVPGLTVNFASDGTILASAITDKQGQAQTTIGGGGLGIGTYQILSSVKFGTQTYTVVFTINFDAAGPIIKSDGFRNGAGSQVNSISPCSLATTSFVNSIDGISGFVPPLIEGQAQGAGIAVFFDGYSAPILNVHPNTVTLQVPCEVTPGAPAYVNAVLGGAIWQYSITPAVFSPGIFQTTMSDGKLRAVLARPDGSFVSLENPAQRGEIIRMYVTGLGQTTPPLVTGQIAPLAPDPSGNLVPEVQKVNAQVVVGVNNSGVPVVSATYAYGRVGVYEVLFQVPVDTGTSNDAPLAIAVAQGGTLTFGNPSLIPIQ